MTSHIDAMTKRRQTRHRAFDPDPDAPGRMCDMPGCTANAGYRAPKSRQTLQEYYWFCLDHVREYNAKWDFYKGMTPIQIETHLQSDSFWQRPSWKLGSLGKPSKFEERLRDPLGLLSRARHARARALPHDALKSRAPKPIKQHLSALGLDWPLTMEELRAHYRNLARHHHPDANGSDPRAEARFKEINVAYTTIRAFLSTQ